MSIESWGENSKSKEKVRKTQREDTVENGARRKRAVTTHKEMHEDRKGAALTDWHICPLATLPDNHSAFPFSNSSSPQLSQEILHRNLKLRVFAPKTPEISFWKISCIWINVTHGVISTAQVSYGKKPLIILKYLFTHQPACFRVYDEGSATVMQLIGTWNTHPANAWIHLVRTICFVMPFDFQQSHG